MLNFKDWEKVSGDEKTSTLKHHKGHIMTIAHDALPKIQMEQLKRLKMAEGGKVESGKQRFDNEKGVHADPGEGDDGGMSMAGVFSRHAKDDGVGKESKDRAIKEHKRVLNEQKEMQKKDRKYLDEGTPDEPLSSDQKDSTEQSIPGSHDTHITINAAAPASPAQPPVQPAPPQNAQAQMVSQNTPEQVKATPVGGSQVITNPRGAAASSIGTENKALQEQQAIDSQKAQMQGQSDVALEQQQNQIAQQAQENFNELKSHTDDFAEHVKSIDPDRLIKNMGLGQKIATSLSLILGGAAGKGRSNMALDDLNKRIDRDVAAQQADINNQHTVFGAYEHLYGDSVIATNLAKVSANDIALTQAKVIADKLGTQQAQQNYDLLAGKLGKENTQLLGMAAKIKTGIQNGTIVPRVSHGRHPVINNSNAPMSKSSGSFMNNSNASNGPVKNESGNNIPVYKVLTPHAIKDSVGLSGVKLVDQGKLQNQLTMAQQAESVLNGPKNNGKGGIDDLIDQMYEDIGRGSPGASLEQNIKSAAESVPYLGHIGEKGLSAIYSSSGYKNYRGNEQTLKTDIASALHGIISVNDFDQIIDANKPVHGDTKEDVERKKERIRNTIIKALPHDELEKWNLWNKK